MSRFDTSSRIIDAAPGDAVVLHNGSEFWALVYIVKVFARQALNRELAIEFRYARPPTPNFSGFVFPGTDAGRRGRDARPCRRSRSQSPAARKLTGQRPTRRPHRVAGGQVPLGHIVLAVGLTVRRPISLVITGVAARGRSPPSSQLIAILDGPNTCP